MSRTADEWARVAMEASPEPSIQAIRYDMEGWVAPDACYRCKGGGSRWYQEKRQAGKGKNRRPLNRPIAVCRHCGSETQFVSGSVPRAAGPSRPWDADLRMGKVVRRALLKSLAQGFLSKRRKRQLRYEAIIFWAYVTQYRGTGGGRIRLLADAKVKFPLVTWTEAKIRSHIESGRRDWAARLAKHGFPIEGDEQWQGREEPTRAQAT